MVFALFLEWRSIILISILATILLKICSKPNTTEIFINSYDISSINGDLGE